MGNSNQCKIEQKISNDYDSTKAGALRGGSRLRDAAARAASPGRWPLPADTRDEFLK